MTDTLKDIELKEKKLLEKQEQYESVHYKATKFVQETEASVIQEKRLLSELTDLFNQSEDRHFFHDIQQAYQKESRTFANRLEEDSQDLKRQSKRLEEKVKNVQSEKNILTKKEAKE